MVDTKPLKQKLKDGRPVVGCWLSMSSAPVAEIIAHAGFDFVIIDHEHAPGTLTDAGDELRAMSATDVSAIIRVPWNDPVYIKRALDTGAHGVMVPMVETADDARRAVAACRYPPDGIRGAAYTQIRASRYGLLADDYLRTVNDNLVIICQVESARTVDNIAEIAAVDGIDVLFVGPSDLSGSVGKLGQFDDPEVRDLFARTEAALRTSGITMGTVPRTDADWRALVDAGYTMMASASDVALLRTGAAAHVGAFRDHTG